MTRDHDDGRTNRIGLLPLWGGRVGLFQRLKHLHSVHLRHFDIGEDEVVRFGLRHLQTLLAVFCYFHLMSFVGKDLFERIANAAFVVYNQYF